MRYYTYKIIEKNQKFYIEITRSDNKKYMFKDICNKNFFLNSKKEAQDFISDRYKIDDIIS